MCSLKLHRFNLGQIVGWPQTAAFFFAKRGGSLLCKLVNDFHVF